jgi:NAD(P)H dehydrogenase (quinone)
MAWADAVIFGSPTRFENVTAQLKQFLDSLGRLWHAGQPADKVYNSGFTSSSTTHGGQESALLAPYKTSLASVPAQSANVVHGISG